MPLFESSANLEAGANQPDSRSLSELTFEQAFEALQDTVRRLEQGDSTIDQLVALYERGVELASHCGARLDAAELRITQIKPAAGGGFEEVEFDE
jgi:exodeoxyribonuclease VII small subunit